MKHFQFEMPQVNVEKTIRVPRDLFYR